MSALTRLALACALAAASTPAAAERLVLSISRHQVLVNSSFDGTSIVLFGTVEPDTPGARQRIRDYDLVVTVIGPRQNAVARRKERVLGIWANVDSRNFIKIPGYLAVLANKPFDQIAKPDVLRRLQIGFDNILLPQRIGSDIGDVSPDDQFRKSFIRLKSEQGLYVERPNGVTFMTPTVFRAGIPLPAVAPFGDYEVDVKLMSNGTTIVRNNSAFELVKVGFEQFVASAARDYGLLYGLAIAMLSVLTGWFASVVFRRD